MVIYVILVPDSISVEAYVEPLGPICVVSHCLTSRKGIKAAAASCSKTV